MNLQRILATVNFDNDDNLTRHVRGEREEGGVGVREREMERRGGGHRGEEGGGGRREGGEAGSERREGEERGEEEDARAMDECDNVRDEGQDLDVSVEDEDEGD